MTKNIYQKVKSYMQSKKDAWNSKDSFGLYYDNPFLFELKWTIENLERLYKIASEERKIGGKSSLLTALKYDLDMTKVRSELRNMRSNARAVRLKAFSAYR